MIWAAPNSELSNAMTSSNGLSFAPVIASRKEQSALQTPSSVSAVFVTVKVAASEGELRSLRKTTPRRRRPELSILCEDPCRQISPCRQTTYVVQKIDS
jgi:hypothetical protein